jgi:hypothetical protein
VRGWRRRRLRRRWKREHRLCYDVIIIRRMENARPSRVKYAKLDISAYGEDALTNRLCRREIAERIRRGARRKRETSLIVPLEYARQHHARRRGVARKVLTHPIPVF